MQISCGLFQSHFEACWNLLGFTQRHTKKVWKTSRKQQFLEALLCCLHHSASHCVAVVVVLCTSVIC